MPKFRALSLILFLVVTSAYVTGADYFVSARGNDSNAGTSPQAAWRTLERASRARLQPGDRLLLEGGAVFEGTLSLDATDAGTAEKPVTVASYGSGKARILAGNGYGVLVRDAGGIVIEDLWVGGAGPKHNHGGGVAVINALPGGRKLEHVRIRRVEASGFGRTRKESEFHRASGCGIFVGGDPEDRSDSGYRDVIIEDSKAYDNEYFGILVSSANGSPKDDSRYANENVIIRRCQAYDNPGDPEFVENHSGSGILLSHCDVGLIEHSKAWNNGDRCGSKTGGPVGIWAWAANRVTIQYCEAHHNKSPGHDGGGFDFDGGVSNSVMQYNYSHDNEGTGYLLYTYPGSIYRFENNIVRHCVSRNDGYHDHRAAIWIRNDDQGGIHNLEIHHNTFIYEPVGNDNGVVSVVNTEGVRFHHNAFITSGNAPLIKQEKNKGLTFQDNLYSPGRGGFRVLWDGKEYTDFALWARETGQER
ncbi:MAG: right-handed parallel beta-helix repeat-containing protein [Bryobacterales bacterium]|nr:right-handed parallel beta-helix repeat-containing protein [Bryobacterales bacterium]